MNAASATATAQIQDEPYVSISFSLQGRQLPADHGYLVYAAISLATGYAHPPAGSVDVPSAPSPLHRADWLAIELISGFPSGRGLIALPERDATLRLRIPAGHYRDVLPLAGKRLDIGGHQIRLGLPVARPLEPAPSLYARVVTIKKFTEAEPFIEAVKRKLDSFGVQGRVELPRSEPPAVAGGHSGVSLRSGDASQHHLRERLGSNDDSKLETTSQYHLRQRVGQAGYAPEVSNSKLETQNSKLRYRRRIVTIHGKAVVGFSVAVHDLNDEDSLLLQAGAVKVVSPDDGATQWHSIFSRRAMGCGFFNPPSVKSQMKVSERPYQQEKTSWLRTQVATLRS